MSRLAADSLIAHITAAGGPFYTVTLDVAVMPSLLRWFGLHFHGWLAVRIGPRGAGPFVVIAEQMPYRHGIRRLSVDEARRHLGLWLRHRREDEVSGSEGWLAVLLEEEVA